VGITHHCGAQVYRGVMIPGGEVGQVAADVLGVGMPSMSYRAGAWCQWPVARSRSPAAWHVHAMPLCARAWEFLRIAQTQPHDTA
jgi:hypothetical protein